MKCKTVEQMKRVARYGALKMPEQGYTVAKVEWGGSTVFEVTKADGTTYHVDLSIGENGWCPCAFHVENRHLAPATCCKHSTLCRWKQEAEDNRAIHAVYAEIAQNGGGIGVPCISNDPRMEKMFAHPADAIEARIY